MSFVKQPEQTREHPVTVNRGVPVVRPVEGRVERPRPADVVGTGQVVGLGRAEEAEAVLQHLEHPVAGDLDALLGHVLEDGEHHVALAHRRGVLDLEFLGELEQICRALGLQVGQRQLLEISG